MNVAAPTSRARDLRTRIDRLTGEREQLSRRRQDKEGEVQRLEQFLARSDKVEAALKTLSDQMFGQVVEALESTLTLALQEVLEQPLRFKVERSYKRSVATLDFHIERDGKPEDILRGQGGSVANVLSVGLRLLALTRLDSGVHRRFLVLDEQDCWLRPDLVPRFVRIVHDAADALGFQVLMISHHEVAAFRQYADRIYQFTPTPEGVRVSEAPGQDES